jgi:NTP pyrophosphatase (non-canonical NTP hydrolase)
MTLEQLQSEVSEWSNRNFPNNKPHHPLLGIVEELGEFFSAMSEEDEADAVADALIYCADYAARNGLVMLELADNETVFNEEAISKLCHYHLKGEQGIRYKAEEILHLKQTAFMAVVGHIIAMADIQDIDWRAALTATWSKVKQRNWVAKPLTAADVAAEQNIFPRKP